MSKEWSDQRTALAERAFRDGDVATAKRILQEVLAADPGHEESRALYGQCLRGAPPPDERAAPPRGPEDGDDPEPQHEQLLTLEARWYGRQLVVRFDWPPGARSVIIGLAAADGTPPEAAAIRDAGTPLTRKGYDDAGGLHLAPRPPPGPAVWVFVFEGARAVGWLRVARPREPVVWHVHAERTLWRAVVRRALHVRGADLPELTELRLVRSPDRTPLAPSDGETVLLVERLALAGGAGCVELPAGIAPGVLRLFPSEADRARGVWCLAEEGRDRIEP